MTSSTAKAMASMPAWQLRDDLCRASPLHRFRGFGKTLDVGLLQPVHLYFFSGAKCFAYGGKVPWHQYAPGQAFAPAAHQGKDTDIGQS